MTVTTTTNRQQYDGDNANLNWPFSFKFLDNSHIQVTKILANGAAVPLTITTDYTVTGAGASNGGQVTTLAPIGNGNKILIRRIVPVVQTTSIRNQRAFFPQVHEDAFDYLTMITQQFQEVANNALQLDAGLVYWDGKGKQIKNIAPGTLPTDAINWQQLIDQIAAVTGDIVNTNNIYYNGQPLTTFLGTVLTSASNLAGSKVQIGGTTLTALLQSSNCFTVNTVAALRAFDTTVGSRAFVLGYYAPGDGGGGLYYLDAADTTSADNGGSILTPAVAAAGRWKLNPVGGVISVKQFGAKGDNTTNDRASIQAALDSISQGVVYFPAGQYKIGSGLTWLKNGAVNMRGDGPLQSQIIATYATGDMVTIGSTGTNPNNCIFENLLLSTTVTRTSGAGLRFKNGHNCVARDIRIESQFHAIILDGGAQQYLYTVENFEINNGARGIYVGSDGTLPQDLFIGSGSIAGCTDAGIYFKNVSGVYMDRVDCISCKNGIVAAPAVSEVCTAVWCNAVLADTCTDIGWLIQTQGGITASWHLVSCWASSCGPTVAGANGMQFAAGSGTMRNICLEAPQVIGNGGHGIAVSAVEAFSIVNPKVFDNGKSAVNTCDGILINAGMVGWSIVGGKVGIGAPYSVAVQQRYGINVGTGCDQFVIDGVVTLGNATKGIGMGATPADAHVSNCPGFITRNKGVGLINVGSGSVVVTHGLGFTPIAQDIMLTAATNPAASGITTFYVTGLTATQFTIACNQNAVSAPLYISWSASLLGA